jgi:hypothetical protein
MNINQINTVKSTNRLHQAEERISGIKGKIREILHFDNNKEKICKHDHNFKN